MALAPHEPGGTTATRDVGGRIGNTRGPDELWRPESKSVSPSVGSCDTDVTSGCDDRSAVKSVDVAIKSDVKPVVTTGMLALVATGMDHYVPKCTMEKKADSLTSIADMDGTEPHDKGEEKVRKESPPAPVGEKEDATPGRTGTSGTIL